MFLEHIVTFNPHFADEWCHCTFRKCYHFRTTRNEWQLQQNDHTQTMDRDFTVTPTMTFLPLLSTLLHSGATVPEIFL